ncbi:MAG: transporter substrate-binding domain-containing protein [Proteobacteria bacterium]|nr:transporter substrate-binding domain-containing protein [Pseudomonadota bacterium]
MLKVGKYFVLAVFCFCLMFAQAQARDLKASVPFPLAPLVESKDKGILIDLMKAMAEEYKDGKITWELFPFKRSMENVEKGKYDFHMPQLVNPKIPAEKLPFMFSSEMIFKVIFALYTNKNNKDINPGNASKYKIESDLGTMDFFDFKVTGSPDIESSLKKVDMGRIDGWLFAMPESDGALKKLGLKNIKRWEFAKYDVRIVLTKSAQGKEVDKILTDLIGKLKANGKYQKIMGPILDQKFDPWQP